MEPESLSARHNLISLMAFTWCAFPVAFILGPELTGTVNYQACAIIYAILDLFCKNLYGFMCWHFNYRNAYSYSGRLLGLTPDAGRDMYRIKMRNSRKSPKRKSTVPSAVHGYVSPQSSIGSALHLQAGASPVRASLPTGLSSPQPSPSGSAGAQNSHPRMLQEQSGNHHSHFQLLFDAIVEQNSCIREMQNAVLKNKLKSDVEPAADEPASSIVRIAE